MRKTKNESLNSARIALTQKNKIELEISNLKSVTIENSQQFNSTSLELNSVPLIQKREVSQPILSLYQALLKTDTSLDTICSILF